MIVVVDYGRGNLFSLGQALRHIGAEHVVSDDAERVARASTLILPGVGAFGDAAVGLSARGLIEPLKRAVARGASLLGICVGCQLLLDESEEFGRHAGLGIIPGKVARLPQPSAGDADGIRIPNVGWRRLDMRPGEPLFRNLPSPPMVYFVHSYAPMVDDEAHAIAHIAINGRRIPAAIRKGAVVGFQFHPEKSGVVGLALLRNFVEASVAAAA